MIHVCPKCLSCVTHLIAENQGFCNRCENIWTEPVVYKREYQIMGFNPESPGWIKLQSRKKNEDFFLHDLHESATPPS